MKISIIGTGYVGLSTALGFAQKGHTCLCVDIDPLKVRNLNRGIPTFYEKDIEETLKNALEKKLLIATEDYEYAINNSDITFICVGTPSNLDGTADLSHLYSAVNSIGKALKEKEAYHTVCIRSTVLPGTTKSLLEMIKKVSGKIPGQDFGMAMNPEFMMEGSSLHDFLNPYRIVIGELDENSGKVIESIYSGFDAPIMRTSLQTAEMIKYASNAFLAAKISFINELGNLCKKLGIDIYEVARGMGYDKRIAPYHLNAGCGFGGSCFPKDVLALLALFKEKGEKSDLIEAVLKTNEAQKSRIIDILKKKIDPANKKIAILGLAFKEDSDDIRDSVALEVIKKLRQMKSSIFAYDPMASKAMKNVFPDVNYVSSIREALEGADACLILTGWKEFSDLSDADFSVMKNHIIIEGRKILDRTQVSSFEGVCW